MLKRKKSKRGKPGFSKPELKPPTEKPKKFERTVQAKNGEKIWVSTKKEEDYSKLWKLFEVASVSSDKKSVYVSDTFTGNIEEVKAIETLSFDHCHEENYQDLTRMNYLHEASLLNCLEKRYFNDNIYTWFGDTLISINPYCETKNSEEMNAPHVTSVATRSFEILKQKRKSQSIVINGDSGAGKTEAAKKIMRHLVKESDEKTPKIEEIVLSSTPVLEAFGNSVTLRNDNSSRFGRFIQILYSDAGNNIIGMNTKPFLLEKSRLIQHTPGERNYHIFYQLCETNVYDLGFMSKENYDYLLPILSVDNYKGVIPNDKEICDVTLESLNKIGITEEAQKEMFKVLLGILNLGNIKFIPNEEDKNNTNSCNLSSQEFLMKTSEVLGLDNKTLEKSLITRVLETKNDKTVIELTIEQATDSRNGLSKYLYSLLFNWLIQELNKQSNMNIKTNKNKKKKGKFIGILDIFGFEDLENNSFEQILVNYSNELLQNQFNLHIISSERKLFLEEGVTFPDITLPSIIAAEQVLNTLTNVVFSRLEEQCLLKSGTDKGFLSNLKKTEKLKLDWKKSSNFVITHFAGEVSYNCEGFIHKNRDSLVEDLKECLYESDNMILKEMIKPKTKKNKKMSNKETVLKEFQNDMNNLISTLTSTDTTFVRCIKPNHAQNSKDWDVNLILSQLEYLGILQAIRVHDETYPVRRPFSFIPEKYATLFEGIEYFPGVNDKEVMKAILVKALGEESEFKLWQCGHTKVFLGNQVLFQLDNMVNEKRKAELAAMSEKQRQLELEKEKERQREELRQAKLKLEKDNEALMEQHRKQFEEKEKAFKRQLQRKEEEMQKALAQMKADYESRLKAENEEIIISQKARIKQLEARVAELEEESNQKEEALQKREKEVEERLKEAEEGIRKKQLALEHAQQKSAFTKEETEKVKKMKEEQLLKLKQKETEIELQHEKLKKDQHDRELEHQRKAYEFQLAEEKLKREQETHELHRKMFEKEKKRIEMKEKRLKEEEEARLEQAANDRLRKAAMRREKDKKKFVKQREYGAIQMQKIVRGFLIKRNYQDMLQRSEHFRPILKDGEKVIFSSIVINEAPIGKASKTKRRVMVLTSRSRLFICDPLTLKIEQKGKYDPKLCKSSATGVHGRLNIYLKSDWLATDSSEWKIRDIVNDATTWVAVLSTMTHYSEYIKKGFYKCLKKRANKKNIIIPIKFGLLKMMDERGKYSAGDRMKQKKGKISGGAHFVLCRRHTKHSIIWFENDKSEVPGGDAISIDKHGKILIPNEASAGGGKVNIYMFCLLIKKKSGENMISFETRGRKDRDSWSKEIKKIIRRDKFRIHDIEKIKKQRKAQRARESNRPKSSNPSRNSNAVRSRDKDEDIASLIASDERPSGKSSYRQSQKGGRKTVELTSSSAPKSKEGRKRGKSFRLTRTTSKRGKKKKGKSKFNAETFLTAFEQADHSSAANISGMKKS